MKKCDDVLFFKILDQLVVEPPRPRKASATPPSEGGELFVAVGSAIKATTERCDDVLFKILKTKQLRANHKSSPPSEGGVSAASADGVVLFPRAPSQLTSSSSPLSAPSV